jgi:hypothetical protein
MMSAIIKLIMLPIRCPSRKVEFPIVILTAFRFPAGINRMNGVIISLTKSVTNLEAAWPITNQK